MRRILLPFLAAVLLLSAVEWETEQVTDDPYYESWEPVLAAAPDGSVRIAFAQPGDTSGFIKVASNKTGEWVLVDAAEVDEAYFYSVDVDGEGITYVAFAEWAGEENSDVFLASDKEGEFTVTNVTNDPALQDAPVVRIDPSGVPHLLFAELIPPERIELFYGVADGEGFNKEQVTENLYPEYFMGYDLVLVGDEPPYGRHVFYIGDDGYLWDASILPVSASRAAGWPAEAINDVPFSQYPSARADALDHLHVSYDDDEKIHYLTNKTDSWADEVVSIVYYDYRSCLDLDSHGNPHLAWLRYVDPDEDIYYGNNIGGSWINEAITSTPDKYEWFGYERFFAVDARGYGHVAYESYDENEASQINHAKSKEPLVGGITENSPQSTPLGLKVRGGAVYFSLSQTSLIRLDLYDAAGRLLDHLASGTYPEGTHSIPINSAGLVAGVYFVRAEINGRSASAKFVLTH